MHSAGPESLDLAAGAQRFRLERQAILHGIVTEHRPKMHGRSLELLSHA